MLLKDGVYIMEDKSNIKVGVGVLLSKDGEILLGKRKQSQFELGFCWCMPGGKLEWGETFEEAALRELLEETGIVALSLKVISVTNDIGPEEHYVTIGLQATEFKGEPRLNEPEKFEEWQWFPLDRLPEHIYTPSKKMIESFKNMQEKA